MRKFAIAFAAFAAVGMAMALTSSARAEAPVLRRPNIRMPLLGGGNLVKLFT